MAGVGQLRCDWNISLLQATFLQLDLFWMAWCILEVNSTSRLFLDIFHCVQDVAAPSYANLLAEAARRLGPGTAFYKLWPVQPVREPWSVLVTALHRELSSRPVVHTAAGGGRWLLPDHAVYIDGAVQRCAPLSCVTCSSRAET